MRTKIRTAVDIKPGMVIRTTGQDSYGLDLSQFRQVAKVEKLWWDVYITFTDRSRARVGTCREFELTRSKAHRNAAKARAITGPTSDLASALNLLGGYARTAVAA